MKSDALKQLLATTEADLARERHARAATKELLDKSKDKLADLHADAAVLHDELAGVRGELVRQRAENAELGEKLISSELEAKNRKMHVLEGADRFVF